MCAATTRATIAATASQEHRSSRVMVVLSVRWARYGRVRLGAAPLSVSTRSTVIPQPANQARRQNRRRSPGARRVVVRRRPAGSGRRWRCAGGVADDGLAVAPLGGGRLPVAVALHRPWMRWPHMRAPLPVSAHYSIVNVHFISVWVPGRTVQGLALNSVERLSAGRRWWTRLSPPPRRTRP